MHYKNLWQFPSYRQEYIIMVCTYLNSYLLGAPREYILHGLDPDDLDWASCRSSFSRKFLVCPGSPSTLLFVLTERVSQLTSSLLSGQLLTNVQVNNMAALHDTHIYTSHQYYYSSSSLHFFHSSWQASWHRPFPSGTSSVLLRMIEINFISQILKKRQSHKIFGLGTFSRIIPTRSLIHNLMPVWIWLWICQSILLLRSYCSLAHSTDQLLHYGLCA